MCEFAVDIDIVELIHVVRVQWNNGNFWSIWKAHHELVVFFPHGGLFGCLDEGFQIIAGGNVKDLNEVPVCFKRLFIFRFDRR